MSFALSTRVSSVTDRPYVKTHGRWLYRRLSDGTYLWTGPHGQLFRVDHTGARRITGATEADLDVAGRDDAQRDAG